MVSNATTAATSHTMTSHNTTHNITQYHTQGHHMTSHTIPRTMTSHTMTSHTMTLHVATAKIGHTLNDISKFSAPHISICSSKVPISRWEGRTTYLQKVKQYSVHSFLDGSLQYIFCYSESIYLVTHSLRLLLTKLAAFSLYNLDPNGLGILMTNNANISETQCTIQKYFRTFRYWMHS